MFYVFLAHNGLLEKLFGVSDEKGVFYVNWLCFGFFEGIDSSDFELDTIELGAELKTSDRILEIPNTSLFLLIQRHPQNSSHRRYNINI